MKSAYYGNEGYQYGLIVIDIDIETVLGGFHTTDG